MIRKWLKRAYYREFDFVRERCKTYSDRKLKRAVIFFASRGNKLTETIKLDILLDERFRRDHK